MQYIVTLGILACVLLLAGDVNGSFGQESAIQGIAKEVERVCGGRIRELPSVVIADEPTFRQALKAESRVVDGRLDLDPYKTLPVGVFYRPSENTILFRRGYDGPGALAATIAEVEQFRRMQLFHEMVHVWQYQNVPLIQMKAYGSELVKQALREGHAEYATQIFCKLEKMESLYERIVRQRERSKNAVAMPGAPVIDMYDVSFLYLESFRFFEILEEQKPSLSILEVFQRPLPTERQIAYPKEYLAGEKRARMDFDWLEGFLSARTWQGKDRGHADEVGFVAFRMFLRRIGVRRESEKRQLDGFLNGARFSNSAGTLQVTSLGFESLGCAGQCFEGVLANHQTRIRQMITERRADGGLGIRFAAHRLKMADKNKVVSTLLIVEGPIVVEINEFTVAEGLEAEEQWAQRLLTRYLGSRRIR